MLNSKLANTLAAETPQAEVVDLRLHRQAPIEPGDAALYLSEMLADMRIIAAKSGFKFLAALIDVATEEARLQMVKKPQYADIA
jgi:hypothetical protein